MGRGMHEEDEMVAKNEWHDTWHVSDIWHDKSHV